jgi:hypothetical protein
MIKAQMIRNLVVKGFSVLNTWISNPIYAIGGPGIPGIIHPANPIKSRIMPIIINTTSIQMLKVIFDFK